ncbi:hypothetical protein QBC32DRAFT_326884 [Pseudoneurospora amorphoporcata]|uniref:Uncharacterized protein n=1 Tax=Pseudoneurospora amorphoporcata TaxID=241081 RepID=A0AAN6NPD8_9PEZI|nr:hypothetical protein QBC32DRAFT_326884 [Pseudoneurospora amorphoporcata]
MTSDYFKYIGPPEHVTEEATLWEIALPFKREGPDGSGLPEKDWWNHLHDFRITYTWEVNTGLTKRYGNNLIDRETGVEYKWSDDMKRQSFTLPIRGPDQDPNKEPWKQDWFAFPLGLTNSRADYYLRRFMERQPGGINVIMEPVMEPSVISFEIPGPAPENLWRVYSDATNFVLGRSFPGSNQEKRDRTSSFDCPWDESDYMLILQNCIKAPKIPDDMPIRSHFVTAIFELWIKVENQAGTRTFFNKKLMPLPQTYEWVNAINSPFANAPWTGRSMRSLDGVDVQKASRGDGTPECNEYLIQTNGHGKGTWTMLSKILSEGGTIRRLARNFRAMSPEGQQWLLKRREDTKDWLYNVASALK